MANWLTRRLRESVAATQLPQLQRDHELEESVPASERRTDTRNGDAFPDGSFPITTQKQADDAWNLRGHNEHHTEAEIVAHIRAQVRKHGLTMPGTTGARESLRLLLREAAVTKNGNAYEATIVREGPGNPGDKNYYTKQALREAVTKGLFEGLQAYANHPTASEERERPERDVRALVGHFREARFIDGNPAEVRAKFIPVTGTGYEWVTSLIESALKAPAGRPLIGISIDGYGHAPDQENINGRTYNMVREVTHLGSADIVTRAGAGGMFHRRLQEAWRETGPAERRPDTSKEAPMNAAELQQKIKAGIAKLSEAAGLDEKDSDRADRLVTEAIATLRECADTKVDPDIKIQEKIVEKPVAATSADHDKLAAKLRETETRLQEAETKAADEKKRRKTAEASLRERDHATLAAKVLREADVKPKTAAEWIDDILECDDEASMRRLVETKKAARDEMIAELRESYGVIEGAGPRTPAPAGNPTSGGLLGRLGIDPSDVDA